MAHLAALGAAVAVGDIDEEGAAEVARSVVAGGGRAIAQRCDMGDPEAVAALVDATVRAFGRLDGVDHNAAWTSFRRDTDAVGVDLDAWDRVLAVNARGALVLARHAVPHMAAAGGGSLVFISSGAGTIGEATRVAYGVSKAAIDQLARHLAARYGRQGIRANTVAPGFIRTDTAASAMTEAQLETLRAANPSGRLGEPLDIARVVGFLLSDDSSYINGQTIHVDGGQLVVGRLATTDHPGP